MKLINPDRFHRILPGLLFFIVAWSLLAQESDIITIPVEGRVRPSSLSALRKDGVVYGSLEELSDLAEVKHYYNPQNKKMILWTGTHSIRITSMNPFLLIDDIVYQMPLPALEENGKIYIPLAFFVEITRSTFPKQLDFLQDSDVLKIQGKTTNIDHVEVDEKLNGILVRFKTNKNFKESDIATSLNRGWLNVTLYGGILDSAQFVETSRSRIIKQIIPFQFENSAQISILFEHNTIIRKTYVNQGEVLISLQNEEKPAVPLSASGGIERRKQWLIDKIIIDPGHGGKHPGAVSSTGIKEKEITLDIAKRLKKLLEKTVDASVMMTREDDSYVDLRDRTQFANAKGGKLFISIHVDGNRSRDIRGFSTYFLGEAKTQQALEVAQRENSVVEAEESSEFKDMTYILNAIAQNSYVKESQELADMVNQSMKKWTQIPDQGVHQAGFYVLIGASMPSILVETGFISNSQDERLFRTKTFREKIAQAICDSIFQFKKISEKGID